MMHADDLIASSDETTGQCFKLVGIVFDDEQRAVHEFPLGWRRRHLRAAVTGFLSDQFVRPLDNLVLLHLPIEPDWRLVPYPLK